MPWRKGAAQTASTVLQLSAGGHDITAEVAATLEARELGLMNRLALPFNHGMLFVFPKTDRHCMWMRNTYIPLSVAFLDDMGTIVNIADMHPNTEDVHCAAEPVRYALEMNNNWFRKNGIPPGSRIGGLEKAPFGQ
jgi:uncharacterized membrane protein (UPF0127 family)